MEVCIRNEECQYYKDNDDNSAIDIDWINEWSPVTRGFN